VCTLMRAMGEADAKRAESGDALAKSGANALAIFLTDLGIDQQRCHLDEFAS
jgi:hypothetical protein